jgi:hypothetical protein
MVAATLAVVIWLVGFIAWMAVSILQDKACGLPPTGECDPVSTWATLTLSTWLLAPIGCAVLIGLMSALPERYVGARQAALAAVPVVPLLVIVEAVVAYQV